MNANPLQATALRGAERCMVASNFPVDGLLATHGEVMGGMRTILVALPGPTSAAPCTAPPPRPNRIAAATP